MIAKHVVDLLAMRHKADVFVPECKTGPTQVGRHVRLDAWAMAKSWVNERYYGYEVKVSRSDFLRDDKWRAYLDYCTDFYFVTAPGVINDPGEIPSEAGWLEVAKTGTRLFTRKKAPARLDIEVPDSIFRYIMMSRTEITTRWDASSAFDDEPDDRAAYWRLWLADRLAKQAMGRRVSRAVTEKLAASADAVTLAERKLDAFTSVVACLKAHGIDAEAPSTWLVERSLDEFTKAFTPQQRAALDNTERAAADLVRNLGVVKKLIEKETS